MVRDRRASPRYHPWPLNYLTLGEDNGGILVNISDTGLAFQSISPVQVGQTLTLGIDIPGMGTSGLPVGEVIWTDDAGKSAGLRLRNVSPEMKRVLRLWTAGDSQGSTPEAPSLGSPRTSEFDYRGGPARDIDAVEEPAPRTDIRKLHIDGLHSVRRRRKVFVAACLILSTSAFLSFITLRSLASDGVQMGLTTITNKYKQYRDRLMERGGVAGWIANALGGEAPNANVGQGIANLKDAKGATGRTKQKEKYTPAQAVSLGSSVKGGSENTLASGPPHFRVQGNRQVLVVDPRPNQPIAVHWTEPNTSMRVTVERDSWRVLSADITGQLPEYYEIPSLDATARSELPASVVVVATLDQDGILKAAHAVYGRSSLVSTAVAAVSRWRYSPSQTVGNPAPEDLRIEIIFAQE
jgi:hypothetical protein